MIEQEHQLRLQSINKGQIIHCLVKYILKYHYRKQRLKVLLKTLDKKLAGHRKELVLSSILKIQYHIRKYLKEVRRRRTKVKNMKLKMSKRKKKKKLPAKWKIVNRGGKIIRVNINEERRRKEEKLKKMSGKQKNSELLNNEDRSSGIMTIGDFTPGNMLSGNFTPGGEYIGVTPSTSKNVEDFSG
mmetsp:Transcript_22546/g.20028  ORF Transcript_22546/g.20028 Transcript_22546/m.20028 type:complete len:186 (-) Transcript_22546:407-964(-)